MLFAVNLKIYLTEVDLFSKKEISLSTQLISEKNCCNFTRLNGWFSRKTSNIKLFTSVSHPNSNGSALIWSAWICIDLALLDLAEIKWSNVFCCCRM
jgi:hypothetical protein